MWLRRSMMYPCAIVSAYCFASWWAFSRDLGRRKRQSRALSRRAVASVYAIVRGPVTKKEHPRTPRGQAPPEHRPGRAPRQRPIARTPKGEPMAQARIPEPIHAPKERGVSPRPNPRKPKLARDVHG